MDGSMKELAKLEKLTARPTDSGNVPYVIDPLGPLLQSLHEAKAAVESGAVVEDTFTRLVQAVDERKKEVDDRQKEVYGSLSRLSKALDKKFPSSLPNYSSLFTSESAVQSLEYTVALHLLRTGQFSTADIFLEESSIAFPPELRQRFVELHHILTALRNQDIGPALEWASANKSFLQTRSSPLEFLLHRSHYIQLLLSPDSPNPLAALSYANASLRPFYAEHPAEFRRLLACVLYLPIARLQNSPYADLASPTIRQELELLFGREYCANLGLSRQVPLRVVGDIGGGGALARIEKGRKVMRERKSEWSQTDELPIEIPLPPENRYHSIFACPVSKEQSTEDNPPMMMTCGHVITKTSLQKLSKPGGRVKCPYCPMESLLGAALRVYL